MNTLEKRRLAEAKAQGISSRDNLPTALSENMSASYDFFMSEGLSTASMREWSEPVEQQAKLLRGAPEITERERELLGPNGSVPMKKDVLRKHEALVARLRGDNPNAGYRPYSEINDDIAQRLAPVRKRFESVSQRANFWGATGQFVGGFGAFVQDPVNIASMGIAAPKALATGGTLLARTLKSAGFVGLVSAGTEAAIQPGVYAFKQEIGSPYTFDEAMTSVLYAGVGGGFLGGLIPPGQAAGKMVVNRLSREYRAKVKSGEIKPTKDADAAADVQDEVQEILEDNPLQPTEPGVQAHLEALDVARGQVVADKPVNVDEIVAPHKREIRGETAETIALDPRELEVDAETFQFKSLADEAGVTDRLSGIKQWMPERAGVSIVWERADGKLFVADGHQRLGLAKRLIAEGADPEDIRINSIVLREADGVSAREAMARAAAKNIAEGTGGSVDAAKVMRLVRDEKMDAAIAELPPTSPLVRDARGLTDLGDEAFRAVVNEIVEPRFAALVGRFIKGDKEQLAGLQMMARAKPENLMQAEVMARDMAAAGFNRSQQGGLFGDDEFESLFKERAKAIDTVAKTLRQDKRTFKTLVDRQADIMGHGENRLDVEANMLRATQDQLAIATLMADATMPGPLSDAINQAARDIKASIRPGKAVKPVLDLLRKEKGKSRIEVELDKLPADIKRPKVIPPDDPAFSVRVVEKDGKKTAKISIDRAKFDVDQPNFGYPELPEPLPDGHPLLQDTQKKYGKPVPDPTPNKPDRVKYVYSGKRAAKHEEIIAKAFEKAPAGQRKPLAILMGGGGASGKGTTLGAAQDAGRVPTDGFVHIDPDEIKKVLPEYKKVFEAGDWRGAGVTHEESSDVAKMMQERALADRRNLIIDKTLGDGRKGLQLIEDLKAEGYEVRLIGVTLNPEEALFRALERYYNSGRLPLISAMVKAHKGFNAAFPDYVKVADEALLFDNMARKPHLVGTKGAGREFEILDEIAYTKVESRANLDENAETLRQLAESASRARSPELFDLAQPIDDGRGIREAGVGGDAPRARGTGTDGAGAGPDTAGQSDPTLKAQSLIDENPDLEFPDLRLDEDGNAASATRPAREVFEELDAEAKAVDDLLTCMTGGQNADAG